MPVPLDGAVAAGHSRPSLNAATPGACALQGAALPSAARELAGAAADGAQQPPTALPPLFVHPSAWQAGAPGACGAVVQRSPRVHLTRRVAGASTDAAAHRPVARTSFQPCGGGGACPPVPVEPVSSGSAWGAMCFNAGPAYLLPASSQAAAAGARELQALQQRMQHMTLHGTQAFEALGSSWEANGFMQPQAASRQLSHAPLEWAALSQGAVQGFGQNLSRSGLPHSCANVCGSKAEAWGVPEQPAPQDAWASAPPHAFQLPGPGQDLGLLAQQGPVEQQYPDRYPHSWAPMGPPLPSQGAPCQLLGLGRRRHQVLPELQGYSQGFTPLLPDAPQQQPRPELSCPDQGFGQAAGLLEAPHGSALQLLLAHDGQALQGPLGWLAMAAGPKA